MGRITNALKLLAGAQDATGSQAAADGGQTPVAPLPAVTPITAVTPIPAVTPSSVVVDATDTTKPQDDTQSVTAVSFHGPERHAPAVRPEPEDADDPSTRGRESIGAGGGLAGYESPTVEWSDEHDDREPGVPLDADRRFAAGNARDAGHPEGPVEFTTHDLSPVLFDSLDFSIQATRNLIGELQGDAAQLEAWPLTLGGVEFSTFISACSAAIDEGEVVPRTEWAQRVTSDESQAAKSPRHVDDEDVEPVIPTMIELDEDYHDSIHDSLDEAPDLSFVEPSVELQGEPPLVGEPTWEEVSIEPLAPLHPADDFAIDSDRQDTSLQDAILRDTQPAARQDEEWLAGPTAASDVVWRHADELNWDLPTAYGDPVSLPEALPVGGSQTDSGAQPLELDTVRATEYERQLTAKLSEHDSRGAAVAVAQSIRQTLPGSDSHVVLVLSPGPSADVADTVAQLALLLAREEFARVLLVDANLATSTLTERFEAQREGLLEAVLDGEPWDELVRATSTTGLHLMASGDVVTARGIQIQSDEIVRLRRLVSRWRSAYDYVLIDGGSVELPLTRDLVQQADATFLQVCLGRTDEQQAAAAMQQLQLLGGQVRGCLVLDD